VFTAVTRQAVVAVQGRIDVLSLSALRLQAIQMSRLLFMRMKCVKPAFNGQRYRTNIFFLKYKIH
jgi:hypothetical protein